LTSVSAYYWGVIEVVGQDGVEAYSIRVLMVGVEDLLGLITKKKKN